MNDSTDGSRWRRLLDRGPAWGTLAVSPTRYGVTRYRLDVFPPGISPDDRILLRAWRAWPVWGMAVFLAMEILLVPTLGACPALSISTVVFLGSGAVLAATTAATRGGVRTLSAVRMAGVRGTAIAEGFDVLRSLAHDLADADRALAGGEIDTVAHEFLVWRIYDRMAAGAPAHI
ncbi:DUF6611 family protein [Mycolicibacterium sp.]|uniref:DUF6611 family protein n=1 Tax=Mycolicibacterium sp. TaxID=2320850 RepID=UPI001A18891C|nr:DUF6611 family protein [Mycolicibacterium sp.]MBJ7341508.1 hypothetical protein [Mycolicibacterium sp.]